MLKQSQVHTNGIVVVDFAKTAALNQVANLADRACVDERVIDHQNTVPLLRNLHEVLNLVRIGCKRFLDEYVLALLQRPQCQVVVRRHRRCNRDRVDGRIFDQLTKILRRPHRRIAGVQHRQPVGPQIAHTGHFRARSFVEIPNQIRTPIPVADDANAYQEFSLAACGLSDGCDRGTFRPSRAGTPFTMRWSGTSWVTTAPAPISAPSPIVTPPSITAPLPIEAPRLTRVATTCQSSSVCKRPSVVACG